MTYDELYDAVLKILPRATMGEDLEGQIIIYTDCCVQDSCMSEAYLDNGGQLTPYADGGLLG